MNHALEMIAALEGRLRGVVLSGTLVAKVGIIADPDYHMAYRFGDRRLGDVCRDRVLTIQAIEIAEEIRRTGIVTEFVERLLFQDPSPNIPLAYLHFQECGPDMSRLLERLNFHKHPVGPGQDYWHEVTGQKELPL